MPAPFTLPSGAVLHGLAPDAVPPGPPLLFLHGVGGAAWSWAPQAQALAAHFECVRWEGRGHGAAAPVADAGLADYADDAREALQALWQARRQPALLAAHSMGAMLALALACEQPAQVRGLFLVDPVYAERGDRPAVLRPLLQLATLAVMPLVRSYQRDGRLSQAVSRFVFRRAFLDPQAMAAAWPLQRTVVPLEPPRMLLEAFRGVEGFTFRPWADLVTAPTVILEARQRPRARSRFAALAQRWRGPCTHEIVDGGHYLQLDRPAAVTARLRAFAASL